MDVADLVDLDRYPFDDPGLIANGRSALAADGVFVLDGFLRPEAVALMVAETEALVPLGHHSVVEGTPYLALPDESFPLGHPTGPSAARRWPPSPTTPSRPPAPCAASTSGTR